MPENKNSGTIRNRKRVERLVPSFWVRVHAVIAVVNAMPVSFVIDRTGRVREKHVGFRQAQRAPREASLLKLLKE